MFDQLPTETSAVTGWTWDQYAPYYTALQERPLSAETIDGWLRDWTRISELLGEVGTRLYVATTQNTADADAEARYHTFQKDLLTPARSAEQALKEKLLASGLSTAGFDVPLQKMRTEAALFSEANLPLLTEEQSLRTRYNKTVGAQTIVYKGEELTLSQARPLLMSRDRDVREEVWRLSSERQLADRETLNGLWVEFLRLRRQLAANAGLSDYREYAWRARMRFEYTPEDSLRFHDAIEQVVVPAANKLHEQRRQRLGIDSVRPWDTQVDPLSDTPLKPYESNDIFEDRSSAIFHRVAPELGVQFDQMRTANVLDLPNRKNKGPGGYCTALPVTGLPFIFMNAVGVQSDVRTLVHEAGHAFHAFEKFALPYSQQRAVGAEFNEVASMAMELLSSPYWSASQGGYYEKDADTARARIEHLEGIIQFWPYMAVVDAFQHWVYTHPDAAENPANCDAAWGDLWARFMSREDYSGLEEARVTGWHRKLHIFTYPFYYVEYGMAQLGSVQVWANALRDQEAAVRQYRQALALGGTVSLADLFRAAGAQWRFDAETLGSAVDLIMNTLATLETDLSH